MKKISKSLSALLLNSALIGNFSAYADQVSNIKITGNKRIESSTILEYLNIKAGQEYAPSMQSDAVKSLYSTSLFEDVKVSFNKGELRVDVVEMPMVTKIVITGNNKIKSNIILNEILTTSGESINKNHLASDVEKIKELYKKAGRFAVNIHSYIEKQENNRAKVTFKIEEGPKTGINKISFVGNDKYQDSELKTVILTKESRWFRFLESNDTYDPARVDFDRHLLTQFYNSVGYADFRIISVSTDLSPTKESFSLTYSIEEGEKFNLGKVKIINKLKGAEKLSFDNLITEKEGSVFNLSAIENVAEKISERLSTIGYAQADVDHELHINRDSKTVDVDLIIDNAPKIFINRINVSGNLKTEDRVIRRELKISEGDIYNRTKIQRGERNIRNLDYFGKVNVKLSPTAKDDRYNLDIDVEEKSTASIGFDLGYNTAGGPFGRVSFIERNLVGTGRMLNFGVQTAKKSTHYNLGLTDPNFADTDLSLGGNLFRSYNGRGSGFEQGEMNYSQTSTGGKISLGYDVTEDLYHDIEYMLKQDVLKSPSDKASVFVKEQLGKYNTSSVSHSLTYDQSDSRVLPKNGYILSISQEYAGLGGNNKYLKHDTDAKFFKSFVDNKYTLKLSVGAGHVVGVNGYKVRISDRFNLGDYSLRGFEHAGVGPRDKETKEGLGGQKYYSASLELNFPVGLPKEFNVTGAVFVDAGALWGADTKYVATDGQKTESKFYNDKTPRVSIGCGVIWITRIAPIRFDVATAVKKKSYDKTQSWHIKFSTHI